jgi:TDG/mug DNA glycosylase family protein
MTGAISPDALCTSSQISVTQIHSFPPVADKSATKLILGSMPGKASLAANQYYAHPRNIFWPMMETVMNVRSDLSYATRCKELMQHKVALWDVLMMCTRTGSLDSDIIESSIVPNDFENFLRAHSRIRAILFNGAKAESIYIRHVVPHLSPAFAGIAMRRLPSTSPANASISLVDKVTQWKVVGKEVIPVGGET